MARREKKPVHKVQMTEGKHAVGNIRDCFMRDFKSIDIFNGSCDIPLAHSFGIHRQRFIFNA